MDKINGYFKYDNDKNCLILSCDGKELELSSDDQFMLFIALCKKFCCEEKDVMEKYFKEFQTDHVAFFYPTPKYEVICNDELYNIYLGYTIKKFQKPNANTPIPLTM